MITRIVERNGKLYCANCRMPVKNLRRHYCQFCNREFSNWEEIAIEKYEDIMKGEI